MKYIIALAIALSLSACATANRTAEVAASVIKADPEKRELARFLFCTVSLPRQLVGGLRQCWNIVRVYPSLPLHAAGGKLAGFALGLALGCGFGGGHCVNLFHAAQALRTSGPQAVHQPRVTAHSHCRDAPFHF